MLTLVREPAWQKARAGNRQVSLPVVPGVARVLITAQGWKAARRSAQVAGPDAGEIELIETQDVVFGTFALPERGGGEITLRTDRPPEALTCRTIGETPGTGLCLSIMPASLLGFRPELSTVRPVAPELAAAKLAEGDIQGAIGELAIARLSGLDTRAIAAVILLYLAERPLLRSRLLGALVAALCEEREVP